MEMAGATEHSQTNVPKVTGRNSHHTIIHADHHSASRELSSFRTDKKLLRRGWTGMEIRWSSEQV